MELPMTISPAAAGALMAPPEPAVGMAGMVHGYRRRAPLFLAVLAGFLLAAMLFTWLQTPRYTASTTLMITPTRAEVGVSANAPPDVMTDADVDSQVEVLKSGALAQAVVDKLDLTDDAAFAASLHPRGKLGGHRPSALPVSRADAVPEVETRLAVRRVAQTLVMEAAYTSTDPRLAARIANAYADAYVAQSVGFKLTDSRTSNALLGAQLGTLRRQVEAAETAVARYKAANNLLTVQGSPLAEQGLSARGQPGA